MQVATAAEAGMAGQQQQQQLEEGTLVLPPGFRFFPMDDEIITHYLTPKVVDPSFAAMAIGEVDLNKSEPWELPSKAKMGEKEWYFYSKKDRKYPTGMRTNRATESGYWKATGKDKEIYRRGVGLVGMKKTLVFYRGRAPKGEKTNWVMHEYRLDGKLPFSAADVRRSNSKEEWVVCRVFHKSVGVKKPATSMVSIGDDDLIDSTALPRLMDSSYGYNPVAAGYMPSTSTASSSHAAQASYLAAMMSMDTAAQDLISGGGFGTPAALLYPPAPLMPQNGHYVSMLPPMPPAAPTSGARYAFQDEDASSAVLRRHSRADQTSNQSAVVSRSQDTTGGMSFAGAGGEPGGEISSRGFPDDMHGVWKY